jgi:F0F1-type ATP synthase membrane subunit c/vacuolar-type H+-ATPase subunit K
MHTSSNTAHRYYGVAVLANATWNAYFGGQNFAITSKTPSMSPPHRTQLLAIMANIEQLIAEAQSLMVEVSEEEMVLRASQHLAELRLMLEDVEKRLGEG